MSSLDNMCRLCSKKLNLSLSQNIFAPQHTQLLLKISKCLPITVAENDRYPKFVCSKCADQLDVSFDLYGKCLSAVQVFEEIVTVLNKESRQNELLGVKQETVEINLSTEEDKFLAENEAAHGMICVEEPELKVTLTESTTFSGNDRSDNDGIDNLLWCEYCAEGFKAPPDLEKHILEIHLQTQISIPKQENNTFSNLLPGKIAEEKCNECRKKIPINSQNSPSIPNRCEDCRRYFFTHIYACEKCPKRFLNNQSLSNHMQSHLRRKPLPCKDCPMEFFRKGELYRHMQIHTDEKLPHRIDKKKTYVKINQPCTPDEAKPSFCDTCKKIYTSRGIHNAQLENRCEECARYFFTHAYGCPDCPKRFTNNLALQIHIRIHTGEKPFPCNECDKSFRTNAQRRIHLRVHTGEKPYQCSECDKRFAVKESLVKHFRTHTGERPFQCKECNRGFAQKENLSAHFKTHTGEKPFQCTECDKIFSLKASLVKHFRTHTGERPFQCKECKRSFARKENLSVHFKTHTGEKPFQCTVCKKRFIRRNKLTMHLRIHAGRSGERDVCNTVEELGI